MTDHRDPAVIEQERYDLYLLSLQVKERAVSEDISLPGSVLDGWYQRQPKWRIVGQSYQYEPNVEDDGVIRVTRTARVRTITFTLERDTDDPQRPERQDVIASGLVIINDPPTLLLAFPLEEALYLPLEEAP